MGADFTALIHYSGPTEDALRAIVRLEAEEEDFTLAEVVACGLRNDFAFARHRPEKAYWRSLRNYDEKLSERPCLPSLEACLQLPSHFALTFGRDTVWVYHALRWIFFLKEDEWQRNMLGAVKWFCNLFGARDCIITHDEHPAVIAFRQRVAFSEALATAAKEGEGEVARIRDLFLNEGYAKDMAIQGPDGKRSAVPLWDTRGYWRLPLGDGNAEPSATADPPSE